MENKTAKATEAIAPIKESLSAPIKENTNLREFLIGGMRKLNSKIESLSTMLKKTTSENSSLKRDAALLKGTVEKLNQEIAIIQKEKVSTTQVVSTAPINDKNILILEPKIHSDDLSELATALSKAQGEMEIAGKVSSGYNFKYADLAEVVKASRSALSKNGLSVLQSLVTNKKCNKTFLETILLHASGQWIKSSLEVPKIETVGKAPVQNFGATITYLRRYTYASLVGVVASKEEDLD